MREIHSAQDMIDGVRALYPSGGYTHSIVHRICPCNDGHRCVHNSQARPQYTCVPLAPGETESDATFTHDRKLLAFWHWLDAERDNPSDTNVKLLVKSQQQVIGLENPSFERSGVSAQRSECWSVVGYPSATPFTDARTPGAGHRGFNPAANPDPGAAHRLTLAPGIAGSLRLVTSTATQCQPKLADGMDYLLGAWVKANVGSADVQLAAWVGNGSGTFAVVGYGPAANVGQTWRRVSAVVPATAIQQAASSAGIAAQYLRVGVTLPSPGDLLWTTSR